jgi:hypothetical protein
MMETAYQGLKALAKVVRPLGGQFHSSPGGRSEVARDFKSLEFRGLIHSFSISPGGRTNLRLLPRCPQRLWETVKTLPRAEAS